MAGYRRIARFGALFVVLVVCVGVLGGMQRAKSEQLIAMVEDSSGDMTMLEDSEVFGEDEAEISQEESSGEEVSQEDGTVTVRVLLTDQTGDPIRENVYLTFDENFGDGAYEAGEIVCAADLLTEDFAYIRLEPESADGTFVLTDAEGKEISLPYYGAVELYALEDRYYLVNEVGMEEYLYGVVPGEMPASFEEEALKAQAVCARTFAYRAKTEETYAAWNADLDDSVNSQVYGKESSSDAAKEAVDGTAGQILTFEGEPIQAYFFSASCGYTSGLSIWSENDVDYLTVVCLSNAGEDLSFERFIRDTEVTSYDDDSPYFRWQASLDLSKLGDVSSIRVEDRASSGAVTDLAISFSDKETHITNEYTIRKTLGKAVASLRDKDGNESGGADALPSAYFSIEETDSGVTLYGGGYGHGIGMSQYGANGMAREGYDYPEILETFYPGAEITQIR